MKIKTPQINMPDVNLSSLSVDLLQSQRQWDRLRNPHAVWTRMALGLVLLISLWTHNLFLVLLTILAIFAVPFWFPPYIEGGKDLPFVTRIVDAYQKWTDRASMVQYGLIIWPLTVMSIPIPFMAWAHNSAGLLYFLIAALSTKALFLYNLMTETPTNGKNKNKNKEDDNDSEA